VWFDASCLVSGDRCDRAFRQSLSMLAQAVAEALNKKPCGNKRDAMNADE
jgi:hypothetical protein